MFPVVERVAGFDPKLPSLNRFHLGCHTKCGNVHVLRFNSINQTFLSTNPICLI